MAQSCKVIGILGGMGPEASVEFYRRILRHTPAKRDQDHLPVILFSNPKIPDRTEAILGVGDDPLPELTRTAQALVRAGADFLVIPCVTAHYFLPELQRRISKPVLSMIQTLLGELHSFQGRLKTLGLLATTGTLHTGLLQKPLQEAGFQILTPDAPSQETLVMGAIYGQQGIKAGFLTEENRYKLHMAASQLIRRGARAIIAACTEIPLLLRPEDIPVPLLDPLDILAKAAIKKAMG